MNFMTRDEEVCSAHTHPVATYFTCKIAYALSSGSGLLEGEKSLAKYAWLNQACIRGIIPM